jgi:hypothetical protein
LHFRQHDLFVELVETTLETFGWTPEEGIELGVKNIGQAVQPTARSASDEFKQRLAAKLCKNLAKLEKSQD